MSEPITPNDPHANDPHANAPNEDPEQHLGPEVADPWDEAISTEDPADIYEGAQDPRDSWPGY